MYYIEKDGAYLRRHWCGYNVLKLFFENNKAAGARGLVYLGLCFWQHWRKKVCCLQPVVFSSFTSNNPLGLLQMVQKKTSQTFLHNIYAKKKKIKVFDSKTLW